MTDSDESEIAESNHEGPILRHRTAIRRTDLSLPVKCLLRGSVLNAETSVFDYGCGHGENIELLNAQGILCRGWDPVFRPAEPLVQSDVVNLGYVINVIEDPSERAGTLRAAWALCKKLLVVAAQVQLPGRGRSNVQFGDGVVTSRRTFQKFYSQSELREYLETETGCEAIPAAPGVFYLFKDQVFQQQFLATRYRRKAAGPKRRISEVRFEQHRQLLEKLIDAVTDLGRLPDDVEFSDSNEVVKNFGSLKRAFALIKRVTGTESWDEIRRRRTEDLLVYLALARFRKRPPISKLPFSLQLDVREFFGSYKGACERADQLLYKTGNPESIDEACSRSEVGKLLPNALYVHWSAVDLLEPVLRVYEGCARAYLGEIEDTNIVKLHRTSGKVSYLSYPNFETDPHPALMRSVKLNLRTVELDCWDYFESENPPVLHRKETFLPKNHPLYNKFARLTKQEEKHGLLDDTATIGTRLGWCRRLTECGFLVKGHRLVKVKNHNRGSGSAS